MGIQDLSITLRNPQPQEIELRPFFSYIRVQKLLLTLESHSGLAQKLAINTGWFKANLDTLTGDYDKYTMCIEKIVVDLFSVHMDISFHSNKSEKNNCLYSKNFNWKLGP